MIEIIKLQYNLIKILAKNMTTELKKLQELIQINPNLLKKGEKKMERIDKTKKKDKKEDEKKESNDEYESDDNDSSYSESDSEKFISSTNIDLEKAEDRIRYLMLDLNNEQLKTADLEEKINELNNKLKVQTSTIQYIKECIQFMNSDHSFPSLSIKNVAEYNTNTIENARKMFKLEREYKKIKEYTNIDETIRSNYDLLINRTFMNTKNAYEKVNGSLNKIDQTIKFLTNMFYLLLLTNVATILHNQFF
jgi:hypothetical protein